MYGKKRCHGACLASRGQSETPWQGIYRDFACIESSGRTSSSSWDRENFRQAVHFTQRACGTDRNPSLDLTGRVPLAGLSKIAHRYSSSAGARRIGLALRFHLIFHTVCAAIAGVLQDLFGLSLWLNRDDLDANRHRSLTLTALDMFSKVDLFGHPAMFDQYFAD